MGAASLESVARGVFMCWLLLPAIGLPLSWLAQRRGRPGFLPRLLPWFAIVPAVLLAAYAGASVFLALVSVAGIMSAWELASLAAVGRRAADRVPMTLTLSVLVLAAPLVARFDRDFPVWAVLAVLIFGAGLWLIAGRRESAWPEFALAASLGAALAFWIRLERPFDGFRFVAWAFSVVAVNDIFGFVAGRFIPRGRPWPQLSPGKTWSGYAGGIVAAAAIGQLAAFCLPEFSRTTLLWLAALMAAGGSAGDLAGSAIKRRYGVKDFSRALGPMGGVLDRIDSLAGAGWIFYLVLRGLQIPAG